MEYKIEQLENLLKGHIDGPILHQTVDRLTAPGENYGSLMLKVDIRVKNGDKEETLRAVAKCVPPNKMIRQVFNTSVTFKNESAWYTTIIPTLRKFQSENGVENVADFFQKFYGSRFSLDPDSQEVDGGGVILFENLTVAGYKNADRLVGFNLETSIEILKKLATFHALTLALRLRKPEVFENRVKKYLKTEETTVGFKINENVLQFYRNNSECSHLLPKIEAALKMNPFGSAASNIDRERWFAAIHNDFWVNNIMIKKEKDISPKIIILDLQSCRLGSIAEDLLFFLGSSIDIPIAEKHMDELIKLYYEELVTNLKVLKVDTSRFPYGKFSRELEIEGPFQFAHNIYFVLVIMKEKGTSADTTTEEYNMDDEFRKMSELITDRHKRKYLFLAKEFSKRNWL